MVLRSVLAGALILLPAFACAHDGVVHSTDGEAQVHLLEAPEDTDFPLDLGGSFELIDQAGNARTEVNPNGQMQLLFFGYANCPSICTAALPTMAQVTDQLNNSGMEVTPVMITVDPSSDTVEHIGPGLHKHHADFVGLTGSEEALQVAYDHFKVEKKLMFVDPEYGPVYAHGSHIYLLDAKGKFLTLVPPIVSAERLKEIVKKYAKAGAS